MVKYKFSFDEVALVIRMIVVDISRTIEEVTCTGTSQLVPHANSYQFIKSSRTKFLSQLVPVPTRTNF